MPKLRRRRRQQPKTAASTCAYTSVLLGELALAPNLVKCVDVGGRHAGKRAEIAAGGLDVVDALRDVALRILLVHALAESLLVLADKVKPRQHHPTHLRLGVDQDVERLWIGLGAGVVEQVMDFLPDRDAAFVLSRLELDLLQLFLELMQAIKQVISPLLHVFELAKVYAIPTALEAFDQRRGLMMQRAGIPRIRRALGAPRKDTVSLRGTRYPGETLVGWG